MPLVMPASSASAPSHPLQRAGTVLLASHGLPTLFGAYLVVLSGTNRADSSVVAALSMEVERKRLLPARSRVRSRGQQPACCCSRCCCSRCCCSRCYCCPRRAWLRVRRWPASRTLGTTVSGTIRGAALARAPTPVAPRCGARQMRLNAVRTVAAAPSASSAWPGSGTRPALPATCAATRCCLSVGTCRDTRLASSTSLLLQHSRTAGPRSPPLPRTIDQVFPPPPGGWKTPNWTPTYSTPDSTLLQACDYRWDMSRDPDWDTVLRKYGIVSGTARSPARPPHVVSWCTHHYSVCF